MCEQCIKLQQKIDRYNRALKWPIDQLTTDRLKDGATTFEQQLAHFQTMHGDGVSPK